MPATLKIEVSRGTKIMGEQFKSAGAILIATLALALPVQGSEGRQESAKTDETQPQVEETGPEVRETGPSNGMKTFDAAAVRPVSFLSSLFSTGAFVLALPFAALDPAMDVEKTRRNLVDHPFGYTFKRPLGDFNGSAW